MNSLNYLFQTNLYLILFLGFYMVVLRNETFFKQNRIFLNGSVLLSFLIPCINSNWFQELLITQKVREVTQSVPVAMIYSSVSVQAGEETSGWTTSQLIMWVYLAGVLLFLVRLIMQLIWLKYNLKEKKGAAFSFFKILIVDESLPEKETIINHEKVHVRQWHSLDVILIELAAVINWFNPAIYLYKKEIKHIHEFIADEEAAGLQESKSDYALILLSTTLGVNPHQLTNSFFNQSLIKRRIVMLGKNRSQRTALLKYGLSAPLFAVMLIFSSATIGSDKKTLLAESKKLTYSLIETLKTTDQPDSYKAFLNRNPAVKELAWKIQPYRVIVYLKDGTTEAYKLENPAEKTKAVGKYGEFPYPSSPSAALPKPENEKIVTQVPLQTEIEIPKSAFKSLSQHLANKLIYPAMARDNKISRAVVVSFRINNNLLTDIKILKGAGYGMDEEVTRVIASYNQPVELQNGQYTMGVIFKMQGVTALDNERGLDKSPNYLGNVVVVGYPKDYQTDMQDNLPHDLSKVDVLPEFLGLEKGFSAYLSANIKYPAEAREKKITGRVFITFVVEKDGSLTGIKVLRGLGYGTDEEAVRVMEKSPKWKPGMDNGKPVRVQYTIPISFQLAKKEDSKTFIPPTLPDAIYLVDGSEMRIEDIKKISTASIKSVNVLKGETATQKYGKKGENGVIEIYTKNTVLGTF